MDEREREYLLGRMKDIASVGSDLSSLARAFATVGMHEPAVLLHELKTALDTIVAEIDHNLIHRKQLGTQSDE